MAMGHGQSCWWGLDLVDISPKVVLADWGIPQLLPPLPSGPLLRGPSWPPMVGQPWAMAGPRVPGQNHQCGCSSNLPRLVQDLAVVGLQGAKKGPTLFQNRLHHPPNGLDRFWVLPHRSGLTPPPQGRGFSLAKVFWGNHAIPNYQFDPPYAHKGPQGQLHRGFKSSFADPGFKGSSGGLAAHVFWFLLLTELIMPHAPVGPRDPHRSLGLPWVPQAR